MMGKGASTMTIEATTNNMFDREFQKVSSTCSFINAMVLINIIRHIFYNSALTSLYDKRQSSGFSPQSP